MITIVPPINVILDAQKKEDERARRIREEDALLRGQIILPKGDIAGQYTDFDEALLRHYAAEHKGEQ